MLKAVVIKYKSGSIPGDTKIPFRFLAVLIKDLKSLKDYSVESVIFFARIAGIVNNCHVHRGGGIRDHGAVSVEDPASFGRDTDGPCNALLERLREVLPPQDLKIIQAPDNDKRQYYGKDRQ